MANLVSARYYRPTKALVTGMGATIVLPWVILLGFRNLNSADQLPQQSGDVGRLATFIEAPWWIQFAVVWVLIFLIERAYGFIIKWLTDEAEESTVWRWATISLFILGLPLINRIFLYPYATAPIWDPARGIANAFFNFNEGWRPENTLIFFYLSCWIFVIWVSNRAMGTYEIGQLFAAGLITIVIGVGWLSGLEGPSLTTLFTVYMVCGLGALAFTNIDSKIARGYHSPGRPFTPVGIFQLVGMGLGIIFLSTAVGNWLHPELLRSALRILAPLRNLAVVVFDFLWRLIRPIIEYLIESLDQILDSLARQITVFSADDTTVQGELVDIPTIMEMLEQSTSFRYGLLGLGVVLLLALVWYALSYNIFNPPKVDLEEFEYNEAEAPTNVFASFRDQLRSLRDRILGYRPKTLLTPDTVENMYANICRMASRKGISRLVSQPPDQFLPDLFQAFPENEEALQVLTARYMQVHYGEINLSTAEMQDLKSHYAAIIDNAQKTEEDPEKQS